MKNLTINDIAKLAGVAKSTVSRYLNDGNVSEETRSKLKKIIEENNYEPNKFAQSLKAKKTNFIGIIAPTLHSTVTSRVLMSIDESLKKDGYSSLIMNTSLNKELEVEYLTSLKTLKVDGIILLATEITKEHEKIIKSLNLPILIVGQESRLSNSIIDDDYNAGAKIGEYVANHNHKNILYMGVDESDKAIGIKRKQGVLDELQKIDNVKINQIISDFTSEKSEQLTYEYLKENNPTAIICATDKIALGAIRAIHRQGKVVGEDISVTGFGGYDVSNCRLTTIRFKNEILGKIASTSIIKMINKEEVSNVQIIGFDFEEGNSVGYNNSRKEIL